MSLAQLIEAHRQAYQAYSRALNALDYAEVDRTGAAQDEALFALYSYPCQLIAEVRMKSGYLLTILDGDCLEYEHVAALLQSFAPEEEVAS